MKSTFMKYFIGDLTKNMKLTVVPLITAGFYFAGQIGGCNEATKALEKTGFTMYVKK